MNIQLNKLKAILLYFCQFTDRKFLGKVKLMKLFYFLDFVHTKTYGSPVTYDKYIHLEHGPIPSYIKNLVDQASDDIDNSLLSDTISFEQPQGTIMKRLIPTRSLTEKDLNLFTESELDVLHKICSKYGSMNTKQVEDMSHGESPWKETKILQEIPYTLAANDMDCFVTKEEISMGLQL